MTNVRINGLVGLMNRVREQWAAGIPAEKADPFRDHIQRTLDDVEKICAANEISIAQLPAPSRNVYLYLKNLNLNQLPITVAPNPNQTTTLRVQNLVRIENWVQQELERLAKTRSSGSSALAPNDQARATLCEKIQATVQSVEKIAQDASSTPARLPAQSRRVYEWLVLLSVPENLDAHLESLCVVLEQSGVYASAHQTASLPHLNIELAHRDHLYHIQRSPEAIQLTANEGYVGAPPEVLQALVRLAYRRDDSASVARLREYARGDELGEVLLALSLPTLDFETNTRGHHFDLRDVFVRVNNLYFGGRITAPRLVWNRAHTFRKMGHYAAKTDTVMLSLTLDDARVPGAVVDLVMYHELLHKVMGSQLINGRRYAHTNAFRQAERRFVGYAEADAWLNEWVKQFRVPE